MADKELIVRAKVDSASFRQLQQLVEGMSRPLKNLATDVQRAQSMLGSLAGGPSMAGGQRGVAPSLGGVVSQVMQRGVQNQGQELTRAVNLAKKGMGDLVGVVKKDVGTLKGAFSEIDKAAARTAERMSLFRRDMGGPDRTMASAWPGAGVAGPVGVSQQLRQAQGMPAAAGGGGFLPPGGGWGGPPGSGGGERGHPFAPGVGPGQQGRSASEAAMIGIAVGRAITGTVGGLAGMAQTYKTMELEQVAGGIQATRGRGIRQALSGVPEDVLAMQMLKGLDDKSAFLEVVGAGGQKTEQTRTIANVVGNVLGIGGALVTGQRSTPSGTGGANVGGQATALGGLTGIGGNVEAIAGELMKPGSQFYRAIEMQTQMRALDAIKASNPMWQQGAEQLRGWGQHAQAERMLGGQSVGFRNLEWGYNLSEVLGTAQQQQQQTGLGNVRAMTKGALRGGAAGMDLGTYQQALSSLGMATGMGGKGQDAIKILEEGVARGTVKGFSDPRTSQELAAAIGHAARGQVGVSGEGVANLVGFLGAGASGNLTVAESQARANTLNLMDRQNPWEQGRRLLMAKQTMPGMDPQTAAILASESPEKLLMGGGQYEAMGMSPKDRLRMFNARVKGEMGTAGVLQGLSATDMKDPKKLALALYGMKGYGESWQQATESAKQFLGAEELLGSGKDITEKDMAGLRSKAFKNRGGVGAKVVGTGEAAAGEVDKTMVDIAKNISVEMVKAMMKEYADLEKSKKNMNLSDQLPDGSFENPIWVLPKNAEAQKLLDKAMPTSPEARKKIKALEELAEGKQGRE